MVDHGGWCGLSLENRFIQCYNDHDDLLQCALISIP
jgi:hypothetical protein